MKFGIVYRAFYPDGLCYIGSTTQDLKKRAKEHLRNAESGKEGKFYDQIRSFGEPEWSILCSLTLKKIEDLHMLRRLELFFEEKYRKNSFNRQRPSSGLKFTSRRR